VRYAWVVWVMYLIAAVVGCGGLYAGSEKKVTEKCEYVCYTNVVWDYNWCIIAPAVVCALVVIAMAVPVADWLEQRRHFN